MEKEKVKNITNIKEENPNFKDKILKQIDPEWKENIGKIEDKEEILFLLNEEYGITNKKTDKTKKYSCQTHNYTFLVQKHTIPTLFIYKTPKICYNMKPSKEV